MVYAVEMARGRFGNGPIGSYNKTIDLYLYKNALTESLRTWVGGRTTGPGQSKQEKFAKKSDAEAAYDKRCQEILADGWFDLWVGGSGRVKVKPKSKKETEKELDSLSNDLVAALKKAKGDKKKQASAVEKAAKRYRAARKAAGEPESEFLVHFFAVDGVGLEKKRKPALLRAGLSDEDFARLNTLLQKL
jgi:hypothetical protein